MANAQLLAKSNKFADLRRRLLFLILALVVYRVGAHIPVPGINPVELARLFQSQGGILNLFNMFSGGALSRATVFALGIMPYISASIIMQLMTYAVPSLEALKKEGESGRRKITQYTRIGTLLLALVQAFFIAFGLESSPGLVLSPGFQFRLTAVISLVAGTMFLMWLGEQITERGLGNGISILIFGGIAAGLPSAVGGLFEIVRVQGSSATLMVLIILASVFLVTFFVVFVERGQRKILISYAKRQVGNRVYGGQTSHLPLKLNMAGVIPPIFASSIILLPATAVSWFTSGDSFLWLRNIASMLSPGQPVYVLMYATAIIFFCFFYTALVFNSRETAENLKKSGAFIQGIRPGDHTAKQLDRILSRLTLAGAIYIASVCLFPEFLVLKYNVPFYFGGTSLLIIVVVTMDFWAQVQSYVMTQQYESLLKKSNFKSP